MFDDERTRDISSRADGKKFNLNFHALSEGTVYMANLTATPVAPSFPLLVIPCSWKAISSQIDKNLTSSFYFQALSTASALRFTSFLYLETGITEQRCRRHLPLDKYYFLKAAPPSILDILSFSS